MDFWLLGLVFVSAWVVIWIFSLAARSIQDRTNFDIPVRDVSKKGHHWVYVEAFQPGHYCNVCETNTFHGAQCDFCGILSDDACIKKAAAIPCKPLSSIGPMKHHWVRGNLPHRSLCCVCAEPCGDGPGLQDLSCVWCQAKIHASCQSSFSAICDLGKFRTMIVPPNSVQLKLVGFAGRRHYVVKEVLAPSIPSWSPVIVVCNRKSGNGEGGHILETFRRLLNPTQVLDLAEVRPETGLEWCRLLGERRGRILVAGGDGTVGWILSTIEKLGLDPPPPVGLLPLGTGNDLSRVLGWGSGHTGPVDANAALEAFRWASVVGLDRWLVTIKKRKQFPLRKPDRHLKMSNYLSIGVDALVTLNFHQRRYLLPRVMSGRLMNKLLFFTYGTKDVLEHACKDLDQRVAVFMDGERKELPALEGIVVTNIGCWGAGVRPWELGWNPDIPEQKMDDGLVEVWGLYSSMHIAQMQVGLSEPFRLGQAREVVLEIGDNLESPLPMQVDGEPWLQKQATITLTSCGQAQMLANSQDTPPQLSPSDTSSMFFL